MNKNSGLKEEVVGILSDRTSFDRAIRSLTEAGFGRTDISVLASHDSIDVAGGNSKSWKDALLALFGELKFEGPLVAAGAIGLAAGPEGAALAALIAAGVGGVAAKELMGELTAKPHSEEFANALAAGSILLWVEARDEDRKARAESLLTEAGASNVHVHRRSR